MSNNSLVKSEDQPESLGQTEGGKQVFSQDPEKYSKDFSEQDHLDAAKIHADRASSYEKAIQTKMLKPGSLFNHKAIAGAQERAAKHREAADWHTQLSGDTGKLEAAHLKQAQQAQAEEAQQAAQVQKGGVGSGKKGHRSYKPSSGWGPHYDDYIVNPAHGELTEEGKYKHLHRNLVSLDHEAQGHITYDPQKKEIQALTPEGEKHLAHAAKHAFLTKEKSKWDAEDKAKAEEYRKRNRYLTKASHEDKSPGGLADKKSPKDFDAIQLEAGRKVEMEHTDDPVLAQEIAMDHLTEDPDYYKKLKIIEKALQLRYGIRYKLK